MDVHLGHHRGGRGRIRRGRARGRRRAAARRVVRGAASRARGLPSRQLTRTLASMENHLGAGGRDGSEARLTADEARAALEGLDGDGAALAERIVTPAWYHPILGVLVAAVVVATALP